MIQAVGYSLQPSPVVMLVLQVLHGLTLPAIWTAGVAFAGGVAPRGTESTAVAAFSVTLMGLAVGLGSYACGLLFPAVGGAVTFRYAAYASGVGLALLAAMAAPRGRGLRPGRRFGERDIAA